MRRKPHIFTPTSLWDVWIVMAILVAAVVSYGAFFRSMEPGISLASGAGFSGFYVEGQNPWAQTFVPGDDTTIPVRTASTQQRAKAPAFQ
jgi:hypothetical protein